MVYWSGDKCSPILVMTWCTEGGKCWSGRVTHWTWGLTCWWNNLELGETMPWLSVPNLWFCGGAVNERLDQSPGQKSSKAHSIGHSGYLRRTRIAYMFFCKRKVGLRRTWSLVPSLFGCGGGQGKVVAIGKTIIFLGIRPGTSGNTRQQYG